MKSKYKFLFTINIEYVFIVGKGVYNCDSSASILNGLLGKKQIRTYVLLIRFSFFDLLVSKFLILIRQKNPNFIIVFKINEIWSNFKPPTILVTGNSNKTAMIGRGTIWSSSWSRPYMSTNSNFSVLTPMLFTYYYH